MGRTICLANVIASWLPHWNPGSPWPEISRCLITLGRLSLRILPERSTPPHGSPFPSVRMTVQWQPRDDRGWRLLPSSYCVCQWAKCQPLLWDLILSIAGSIIVLVTRQISGKAEWDPDRRGSGVRTFWDRKANPRTSKPVSPKAYWIAQWQCSVWVRHGQPLGGCL